MFDFKEYTKQRDIAQKRIKRAMAKGIELNYYIPTVAELRAGSELNASAEMLKLNQFLKTGYSLSRERVYSETESAKRSRAYRRRKVAREFAREDYPTKYLEYLKGLDKLNIDIAPRELPAFFAYMDYRFSQGKKAEGIYLFDRFADDFLEMIRNGYKPEQILTDFKKFEADQLLLEEKAGNMSGMDYFKAGALWDAFKNKLS